MSWRFIETFKPEIDLELGNTFLLSGTYPNGVQWVEAAHWDPRGHFTGHKHPTFRPTHWQPMPEPPTAEEDKALRDFVTMIG
jgi:hypothetical protein